jgi:hypothetical protein
MPDRLIRRAHMFMPYTTLHRMSLPMLSPKILFSCFSAMIVHMYGIGYGAFPSLLIGLGF